MDGANFGLEARPSRISFGLKGIADDGISARLAISEEHLREAWAIRHDAYAAEGLISPRADGLLADETDFLPSVNVIVLYKNDVPVATTRVCLYEPDGGIAGADYLPAMSVFHDEIVDLYRNIPPRGPHARLVENARMARHPSLGADAEPTFGLYRMVCYLLLHMEADAVLAAVQRHHMPFYRRLGMSTVADVRKHPKFDAEVGLVASVRDENEHLRKNLRVLGLVSRSDSNFQDFVSGERVPVFGTGQAPAELTGFMGGRFEWSNASRRVNAETADQSYAQPVALAA